MPTTASFFNSFKNSHPNSEIGMIFDGIWKSDNEAQLPVGPWANQYGNAVLWDPIAQPDFEPVLRVQVSIDGGVSWLREQTENPNGFTIKYKVCERVDNCSPMDEKGNGFCFDCHEGYNSLLINGQRFGKGFNGNEINNDIVCGFGDIAVKAKWISPEQAEW